MKIDDSLDVLAVHGVGGATGTLLVALLATAEFGGAGLPEGATVISQFGVQATGVIATAVWSIIATAAIVLLVKTVCGLGSPKMTRPKGWTMCSTARSAIGTDRDMWNERAVGIPCPSSAAAMIARAAPRRAGDKRAVRKLLRPTAQL